MASPAFDYQHLTFGERLRLVGEIWDSLAAEASTSPDAFPLSDAQKADLDRRLTEHDADPSSGIPLDESLARIRAQFPRPA